MRVVGFGVDDTDVTGTRRQGSSQVSELRPLTFVATPAPANSCEGDSGGPVLRASAAGDTIAGVTVSGDPDCALTSVNARLDVDRAWIQDTLRAIDGVAAPGARAPLGAGDSLCDSTCTTDGDCPAGTACADDGRCGLAGMEPGSFAGSCTTDADCGGGVCAANCSCYRPCGGGGCSTGGPASWWLLLGLIALLATGCSRTGATAENHGPCPAGTSLHGAPPPDSRAQWCERRGAKHGPWTEWYASGSVKSRGAFAGGQMTGHWVHYQPDGAVAAEGSYVAGAKDGRWKTYEDGRLVRETTYSKRGAEARFTAYRDDGSRWAEGVFVRQKENGPYREWHPNGQLAAQGDYRDGARVGTWHYWQPDGTPTDVEQGAFAGQD